MALAEATSTAIIGWIGSHAGSEVPAFSDFGRGEVASALGRRVRADEINSDVALAALLALDDMIAAYRASVIVADDIERARTFVLRFDLALRLPDAIHIAIAQRLGATLVSLDKRQLAGARSLGVAGEDPLAAA